MVSIVKVQSNVKAGADVELGHKTVIVGPNGSGKSTIVNSVELALTGRAGDIAGRVDIAREADVMALAKDGVTELEAIVTFDDGMVAAYRTSGSTAKAKKATGDRPTCVQHDMVLPIRTLREALLGSPATARKFLLSRVAGSVTEADVRALIPVAVADRFDMVWKTTAGEVPDRLVSCVETAGSKQREASATAKTAREAAKMASAGRATRPLASEVEQAKAAAKDAKNALADARAFENHGGLLAKAQARLDAATEEATQLVADCAEARRALDALPAAPPAPEPVLTEVLHVAAKCADECLVCGGDAAAVASRAAEVKAYLDAYATRTAAHTSANVKVKQLEARAEAAIAEVERLEASLSELQKPVATSALSAEDAASLVEVTEQRVRDLAIAEQAWATVQRAEATALDAERQAVEWKALKDASESVVEAVLGRALSAFIAAVQSGLPPTDTFDLKLRDGEREVVQFGLVRGDRLHTALSGAEWARVMAAMASACVPTGAYACVVPEERAFDSETLTEVLKALTAIPQQVIITSPISPKRVPKGWTVIKRGE
jgi:energy-coupling factor transporter ATP-binding protein EcfA2